MAKDATDDAPAMSCTVNELGGTVGIGSVKHFLLSFAKAKPDWGE
jgi:hypothetical protein